MKKRTATIISFITALSLSHAQFGLRFSDESFTAEGFNEVYTFGNDQLLVMTDTVVANEEGYIFVDPNTGQLLSSFRLGPRHGALMSPDQQELLMAGSDGTVRTIARYSPTSLELIERAGISLGDSLANTTGIGGGFEVSPDGTFIFSGTDFNQQVNFIAKYDGDFNQRWATSLTYNGMFSQVGIETYPLSNGDVGIFILFNSADPQSGQLVVTDVIGLLDGEDGRLKWTFSYRPPLGSFGNRIEDFRYTFGRDGSFFARATAIFDVSNPLEPVDTSTAKVLRITPDGALAYSKAVTLEGATVIGENYMDDFALLHFSYNDEDSTQFVVLGPNGSITASTAFDEHLTAGDGDLTATRREGTDLAFIRADFSPGGPILARLNLANGDIEFRQLPALLLGVPRYEAVGKVTAVPVAPFNTPEGFSSVSTVLAAELNNGPSMDFRIDLNELPADGSFPLIDLQPSSFSTVTPLTAAVSGVSVIDQQDGWTTGPYSGLPPLTASEVAPSLLPMPVQIEVLSTDDANPPVPMTDLMLSIIGTGPASAELSFLTVANTQYRIRNAITLTNRESFEVVENVQGDGERFTLPISLDSEPEFFIIEILETP